MIALDAAIMDNMELADSFLNEDKEGERPGKGRPIKFEDICDYRDYSDPTNPTGPKIRKVSLKIPSNSLFQKLSCCFEIVLFVWQPNRLHLRPHLQV